MHRGTNYQSSSREKADTANSAPALARVTRWRDATLLSAGSPYDVVIREQNEIRASPTKPRLLLHLHNRIKNLYS